MKRDRLSDSTQKKKNHDKSKVKKLLNTKKKRITG